MMVVVIMMMSSLTFSPNFYILDEPTNHLDMETIEALAKALSKFKVGSFVYRLFLFVDSHVSPSAY